MAALDRQTKCIGHIRIHTRICLNPWCCVHIWVSFCNPWQIWGHRIYHVYKSLLLFNFITLIICLHRCNFVPNKTHNSILLSYATSGTDTTPTFEPVGQPLLNMNAIKPSKRPFLQSYRALKPLYMVRQACWFCATIFMVFPLCSTCA